MVKYQLNLDSDTNVRVYLGAVKRTLKENAKYLSPDYRTVGIPNALEHPEITRY